MRVKAAILHCPIKHLEEDLICSPYGSRWSIASSRWGFQGSSFRRSFCIRGALNRRQGRVVG